MLTRFLLLSALLLTACVVQPAPPVSPSPLPTTAAPATTPTFTLPVLHPPTITKLRVWVPPELAADKNTASGRLLAARLQQFEAQHPQVIIEIRLKAPTGPANLLQTLMAAYNAAPEALPNLIALPYDDLHPATQASLITPLTSWLPTSAFTATYPAAQTMSQVNGTWMAVPFMLDARVLAYQSTAYATPPLQWKQLVTGTFIFPGGEPTALTVLNLYLAEGGTLREGEPPTLEVAPLARVLEILQNLQSTGQVPQATLNYTDTVSTWQVFRERRATLAATSAHWYLAEHFRFDEARAVPLPTLGASPLTLVDGWSWAIINTQPENQALTAQLLTWLNDPAFVAEWTSALQQLPAQPAAVAQWPDKRLASFASLTLINATPRPTAAMLEILGPPITQAVADVLNGRATPLSAATVAAESINDR